MLMFCQDITHARDKGRLTAGYCSTLLLCSMFYIMFFPKITGANIVFMARICLFKIPSDYSLVKCNSVPKY